MPSEEIIAGKSLSGFKRKLDRHLRDVRGFIKANFSFLPVLESAKSMRLCWLIKVDVKVNTPVPRVNYCDGLDRCILYCILFAFMFALLCFCVATEFSVNKDLYYIKVCVRLLAPVPPATVAFSCRFNSSASYWSRLPNHLISTYWL